LGLRAPCDRRWMFVGAWDLVWPKISGPCGAVQVRGRCGAGFPPTVISGWAFRCSGGNSSFMASSGDGGSWLLGLQRSPAQERFSFGSCRSPSVVVNLLR
jgi:hypothetical protein